MKKITLLLSLTVCSFFLSAQHSVARDWNEELLEAIRKDFARPTVHARNLFHSAVVMYDSWAVFDSQANTIFLGKNFFFGIFVAFSSPPPPPFYVQTFHIFGLFILCDHIRMCAWN